MQFPCGCNITKFDPFDLPNCKATWDLIGSGQTKGIFQIESYLGRHWAKRLKPDSVELLSALIAIIRPGVLKAKDERDISMTEIFCRRRHKEEEIKYIDNNIMDILKPTYDIITYQEQILQISQKLCGFNLKEADELRKCVTGDTKFVSKTRGWISIDRLLVEGYKNDLFLIMDENGKQQWKKIEKIWSTGKHDVIAVEGFSGKKVKATKYHQFLTNTGWKARQKLNLEDSLVCAEHIKYDGQDLISRDMAFVIAGLVTEGYFVEKSSHFVNYDIDMMRWFTEAFQREFNTTSNGVDKKQFLIRKNEREKIAKYMKYGLSKNKKLPDIMMGMTLETTRDFLSFILSAEGGITEKTGHFEFTSKSEEFIDQVQLLLLRFGILSYKRIKKNKIYGNFYRLDINNVDYQKIIYNELSNYFSKSKKNSLYKAINRKNNVFSANVIPQNIVQKLINQYPNIASYEGGSIYKKPITKIRLKKLINKIKNQYWLNFINGYHNYEKIKNLNEWYKQKETFDFTIAGQDTPYIIANGLIIHNSIGKKKAKELGELREKFVDGAIQVGYINKDKAEKIYDIISASVRYSFNKSHSISYAQIGYITAYIKQHFPLQFYTSWIRYASEDMDPQKELRELVVDARQTGIEICPPRLDFLKKKAHSHNGKVYFGLADIKGVGEKKLAAVLPKLNGLTSLSWMEHLDLPIPPKMFELFIQAGALSYLKLSRIQMLSELSVWQNITSREKDQIIRKKTLLESLIVSLPTMKVSPSRLETIEGLIYTLKKPSSAQSDSPIILSRFENELLGTSLTCTKAESIDLSMINAKVEDLHKGSKNAILAVELTEIKVITVKKGANKGKLMAFIQAQDITGQIECVVFPDKYEQFQDVLLKGNTAVIQGYLKDSFIINKIWQA